MSVPSAPRSGRLRASLEIARLSNAPTVVSNTIAGSVIGAGAAGAAWSWSGTVSLAVAAVLMYTGGMILNDALDAPIDARERPGRPIPSGRIPRAGALVVSCVLLVAGAAVAWWIGPHPGAAALALVGAVVLYDVVHRAGALAVFIMGLCRGLVYLAAAGLWGAVGDRPYVAAPACALALYTSAFSFVARHEVGDGTSAGDGRAHPARVRSLVGLAPVPLGAVIPVLAAGNWSAPTLGIAAAVAAALLWPALRLARRPCDPRPAVLAWIACFSVIDAGACLALHHGPLAAACAACFIATVLAHRRILGT